jgi:hypothetical protein
MTDKIHDEIEAMFKTCQRKPLTRSTDCGSQILCPLSFMSEEVGRLRESDIYNEQRPPEHRNTGVSDLRRTYRRSFTPKGESS